MKIVEILYETIDPLDKAEALLSLGQINLPNQDPLDHKRLEQLSTNVNTTYQKYPQSKQDLKEAALA